MRRSVAALAGSIVFVLLVPAIAAAQQATGFRSVLALGQGATATAADVAANQATGAVPPAYTNQLALYRDLAVAWPTLTDAELDRHFKRTDFRTFAGGVQSTHTPRAGVTIERDGFNVPVVTGATRDDVMFGAGYAHATDRLFLMDVLRRTARASLSELLGPSAAAGDARQITRQDFSGPELIAQFEQLDDRHGAEGARVQADYRQFVAGINQRIAEVRQDPDRIPAEYAALGAPLEDWRLEDSLAQGVLLVSEFNVAGVGERESALVYAALERRLGARRATRVFDELRRLDDRQAPTTADRRFPDDRPKGRVNRASYAIFDRDSIEQRNALVGTEPQPTAAPPFVTSLTGLRAAMPRRQSNAVLVSAARSASGRPLASMGPQVGYYSPQIFAEIEMHGGGIDVQGVVFPGAAPYVLIGHGKDFAWSGTSPMSDLGDVFVERLCNVDGSTVKTQEEATGHLRGGRCLPLAVREQVLRTPVSPLDPGTPSQTITLRAKRSAHGPITHFATVDGDPVALAQQKTVDFRELDVTLAFARLNANVPTNAREFQLVWRDYPGGENWFYVSKSETAWQLSGFMPKRARGTHPSLPTWGTGRWDWQGWLPFRRNPRSNDPEKGYIISWNNKEAPGWRAPDEVWTLGPTHRSQLLERRLRAELKRAGGKITLAGLVRTTEAAALGDLEGQELLPLLTRLIGPGADPDVRALLDLLNGWRARGAEHRDLKVRGRYEDEAAILLMRQWLPLLVRRFYEPRLGADAIAEINRTVLSLEPGRSEFGGWHGQLHRTLRVALGKRLPRGDRLRELTCGRTRAACRAGAVDALRDAELALRRRFDGRGPEGWRLPVEMQPIVVAGAIGTESFPIQNRGTYHQVVELR